MKKRTASAAALGIALLVPGCGQEAISEQEAYEIANLSDDAEAHHQQFTAAIQELSKEKHCSAGAMRDHGGFWRVPGESYYFIYCGRPSKAINRWYFNPSNSDLTRYKAEL